MLPGLGVRCGVMCGWQVCLCRQLRVLPMHGSGARPHCRSVAAPSCWHRSALSLQVSLSLAIHVRGAQAITVALTSPDSLHHAHTRVRASKPSLVDSSGTARCNCADMSCSPGGSCLDGMCGCFNGYTGIFCDRKVVLCITSSLSWAHPCCACSHMLLCTMMRARPCGTHLR